MNKIDTVFQDIFDAYVYVKTNIAFDAVFALIAGIVITTLIFKLIGIVKDMLQEGKGFNSKHFFELGKEYMFCMLLITILPFFVTSIEKVMSLTAENLVSRIASDGFYDPDNHITHLIKDMIEDCQNMDIMESIVMGPMKAASGVLMSVIGSFFAQAYTYIMHVFLCVRYLMLLMLEIVGPIALICVFNSDTRGSFYTWIKALFGCYMLYPGFIIASTFADEYTALLIRNSVFPAFGLVIFSFILKLSLLSTVKSLVNRWL